MYLPVYFVCKHLVAADFRFAKHKRDGPFVSACFSKNNGKFLEQAVTLQGLECLSVFWSSLGSVEGIA